MNYSTDYFLGKLVIFPISFACWSMTKACPVLAQNQILHTTLCMKCIGIHTYIYIYIFFTLWLLHGLNNAFITELAGAPGLMPLERARPACFLPAPQSFVLHKANRLASPELHVPYTDDDSGCTVTKTCQDIGLGPRKGSSEGSQWEMRVT